MIIGTRMEWTTTVMAIGQDDEEDREKWSLRHSLQKLQNRVPACEEEEEGFLEKVGLPRSTPQEYDLQPVCHLDASWGAGF